MTEKSVAFKMIFVSIHLCSESIAKTPDELSMNYLDLPILWNLSPYALISVFIPSYFTYYSIYYNEIWHGYYSATIDKLIQKIKIQI